MAFRRAIEEGDPDHHAGRCAGHQGRAQRSPRRRAKWRGSAHGARRPRAALDAASAPSTTAPPIAKTTYGMIGVKVWIYKGDIERGKHDRLRALSDRFVRAQRQCARAVVSAASRTGSARRRWAQCPKVMPKRDEVPQESTVAASRARRRAGTASASATTACRRSTTRWHPGRRARGRPCRRQPGVRRCRENLDPCLPGTVRSPRSPPKLRMGSGQGRRGVLGRDREARHHPLRDRRRPRGQGQARSSSASPTRCPSRSAWSSVCPTT